MWHCFKILFKVVCMMFIFFFCFRHPSHDLVSLQALPCSKVSLRGRLSESCLLFGCLDVFLPASIVIIVHFWLGYGDVVQVFPWL